MDETPSLNQRSYLGTILRKLMPEYADYYDGRIYFYCNTLTLKQYRRLLALHYNGLDSQIIAECKPLIEKQPKE